MGANERAIGGAVCLETFCCLFCGHFEGSQEHLVVLGLVAEAGEG